MKEGGDGGGRWGIVDIIELGKHCIAMTGEKMESWKILLFVFVCAMSVSSLTSSDEKEIVLSNDEKQDKYLTVLSITNHILRNVKVELVVAFHLPVPLPVPNY